MSRKVGRASYPPGERVSASGMTGLPSASPKGQAGGLPYLGPAPVHSPIPGAKANGGAP